MKGSIRTDRRYPIGDYKYITFDDTISDIDNDLLLDINFMHSLRLIQLLSFESVFREYISIMVEYPNTTEENLAHIKELLDSELSNIKNILKTYKE